MSKILITGACGYLGQTMVEMMIDKGHDITVIDNLEFQPTNPFFHLFHTGKIHFVFGDVTNKAFLQDYLQNNNFDFIIPLAAVVGFPLSEQKPEYTEMVNFDQICVILRSKNKDAKILFPNTKSGYGQTDGKTECTETQKLKPTSAYGWTKCMAENAIVKRLHGSKKSEFIVFRLATVFGMAPRMRIDLLVNNFVYKAYKDRSLILFEKHFVRNFIHVRDVARAFIYAIDNWDRMKNNIYNLGHPDFNITKIQLAEMIKKELPDLEIIFREGRTDPDKRNYIVSNKKILATGFKFKYPVDKGIKELLEGYKAMKDRRFQNVDDKG